MTMIGLILAALRLHALNLNWLRAPSNNNNSSKHKLLKVLQHHQPAATTTTTTVHSRFLRHPLSSFTLAVQHLRRTKSERRSGKTFCFLRRTIFCAFYAEYFYIVQHGNTPS